MSDYRTPNDVPLVMRYVEFDPLGWQLWSKDRGFQIAGFCTQAEMDRYLDGRRRSLILPETQL